MKLDLSDLFIEWLKQLRTIAKQRGPQAQHLGKQIIGLSVFHIITGDENIFDRQGHYRLRL